MSHDDATNVKVTFVEIEGKLDQGLYARLKELESWKETSARLTWLIITSVIGLTVATIYKTLF